MALLQIGLMLVVLQRYALRVVSRRTLGAMVAAFAAAAFLLSLVLTTVLRMTHGRLGLRMTWLFALVLTTALGALLGLATLALMHWVHTWR